MHRCVISLFILVTLLIVWKLRIVIVAVLQVEYLFISSHLCKSPTPWTLTRPHTSTTFFLSTFFDILASII